jgi:tetratricopeptide (TPR) repeat protein
LLLDKLGGLPLALVQAGAYIQQTNMPVEEYLEHYKDTWVTLMAYQERYPLQEYGERSVLTTWQLLYKQVQAAKPEAAKLLDQWAFLHPEDVSYELVQAAPRVSVQCENGVEDGMGLAASKLSFRDSLSVLGHYSLVNPTEGSTAFSIHPVVHDWSLHNIKDEEAREALCARAIRIVANKVLLLGGNDQLLGAQALLPHARMVATRLEKQPGLTRLEYEIYVTAYFMKKWESSRAVEVLYVRALRGYEEALGAKHTSTLDTVYNLGNLYRDNGEVSKARQMYARAVEGYRRVKGDHDADIEYLREQLSL